MEKKMFSFDIVEYDKGIVYAYNKEEAENKIKEHYRSITGRNVDNKEEFDFTVDEVCKAEDQDVIVTVPW